jgi:uncharacterized membrane-anchored protein YitT (DUF2179 family)
MEQFTQRIKSNYVPAACERHGINVPVKILSFKMLSLFVVRQRIILYEIYSSFTKITREQIDHLTNLS